MSGSASSSDQQSSNSSNDGKPYHLVDVVKLAEDKYSDPVEFESDSDLDDESRITEEEERLYCAAVKASDGFDIPNLPGVLACCLIKPYPMGDDTRKKLQPFCVAGMKHYNQVKKTNYELCGWKRQITKFLEVFYII
ncbi:hypothetical protein HRI_002710200 [Hibiscus trionum]|uniref:Uncharacterized protein n=1 Tax=Hibiscus trionum TaxID=183268 RepID=A0A9W7M7F7_HIBTR|nr:hypothetical protein HRI_002710200 [Hibiscus trionum]